ncbi:MULTISPECIES: hypothetical protein [unclassified Streptomyces]|uniref:hypothetical protein n=1 Tax=unclassified Streptomyces TaxID=2593676 RepID=UPI002DDC1D0B|nr:hypothetical protein [Streptomyces sp. NBC_01237]WRZ73498.1 hypothetical protein OG251_18700 [Streptomyces sp. NBC_01237]WRZ76639.1 hypothetical protein OG251_36250 [Streptomyces sp. NBC_01237]
MKARNCMLNLIFAVLVLVLAVLLAGLLKLRRGVRAPWDAQPIALVGVAGAACGFMAVVWGVGVFAGGLDDRETCELTHHTNYDQAWRDRTGADGKSFFPLANACNEHISLVPAWVNPTIVFLAVLAVSALALALFRIAHAISHRKKLISV